MVIKSELSEKSLPGQILIMVLDDHEWMYQLTPWVGFAQMGWMLTAAQNQIREARDP